MVTYSILSTIYFPIWQPIWPSTRSNSWEICNKQNSEEGKNKDFLDGIGCEFESWLCRIYIISHV